MKSILGKKVKMSQIWKENQVVPVTIIEVPQNVVTLKRTKDKDGYEAVQVKMGRFKKEFKDGNDTNVGDEVKVSIFNEGDLVKVSGTMKGRGFQGVVKRHNFGGGPKTHGQKNRFRAPGSIGSTAFQRVVPGRRMAGHMGDTRVSMMNLKIAAIDAEKNLIYLKGAVPGNRGGLLEIVRVKEAKKK